MERILKETAKHPNEVKWDKDFGAGIVTPTTRSSPRAVRATSTSAGCSHPGRGLLGIAASDEGSPRGAGAGLVTCTVAGAAGVAALYALSGLLGCPRPGSS